LSANRQDARYDDWQPFDGLDCLFPQRTITVIDYNLCSILSCILKGNIEILQCSMLLRVADGMVIGIPPGNLFSATFGAAIEPPRFFSGAGLVPAAAGSGARNARINLCQLQDGQPPSVGTIYSTERIGECEMSGKVIPLSGRESNGEKKTLLTDDDIRLITDLGNRLIDTGKASAMRRYTGQSGRDVVVILDDKGVIEFGIEKSESGYKRFNCDCDTVATSTELRTLLSHLM
jgi:hypothetical protein